MVVTFKKDHQAGVDQHYLYRTFDHPVHPEKISNSSHPIMNPGPASQEPIWHAARATSAAPSYFNAFRVGDATFLDGSMGANNPSMMALKEVQQLHPHPPSTLISIGTGEKTERHTKASKQQLGEIKKHSRRLFYKKYLEWGIDGKSLLTNTQGIAGDAGVLSGVMKTDYVRFDVPNTIRSDQGDCLGSIPLDQWLPPESGQTTLDEIQSIVQNYLEDDEVQSDLDEYARILVALRRRRAKTDHWERFATDVEYHCTLSDPCKQTVRPKNRPTFRRHVEENHKDILRERELEKVLSEHRTTARENAMRAKQQRTKTFNTRRNSRH
jgi:Patatin-like phospholipase